MTVRRNAHYYGIVSPAELSKEIEGAKFRSVYYFYGTEDYRIKEAEKAVLTKFLPRPQQATNHITLSASKQRLEDILTELSMIPMLGDRQVFTISDIQFLTPVQVERILTLLTPADPSRIVILTSPSSKTPKKKSKMLKMLEDKTAAIQFARLQEHSSRGKIKSLLKDRGIEIEPEALDILVELGGGNLGGMIGEANKLIDYVGEDGTISKEDVAAVSSDYQVFKVFELVERAAFGDFDKAMNIIDFLARRGEKLSSLLFWMGEHFIGLYLAKNRKPFGAGKRDFSWKFRDQINLFENSQLERIIKLIAEADSELRSNIKPERLILEKLIYNICAEHKKTANA